MWRRRDGRRSRGEMRRTVSQRNRCAHQPTDRPVRLPTLTQEGSEAASRAVKGAAAVGVGVCVVQVGREMSSGIHVPGLLALATASAARSTVSFIILYHERHQVWSSRFNLWPCRRFWAVFAAPEF